MKVRNSVSLAVVVLLVTSGCASKPDRAAANKQAVADCLAALDKMDYARVKELVASGDAGKKPIKIVGSPDMNLDELIAFVQAYWKAFPDTKHTIHELVAEGDTVVARVTCEGTQRGSFEGLPPSGARIKYAGVHFVRFSNGKITEWWGLDDSLGMMTQLGMQLTASQTPPPTPRNQ